MLCRFVFIDKNNKEKIKGKKKKRLQYISPLEITTDVMEFDLFY